MRFAAALIDTIILSILSFIVLFITGFFVFISLPFGGTDILEMPEETLPILFITLYILSSVIGIILMWLYFTAFEASSKQATPGKMALGIIVTDLEGTRISFARANGRYWSKIISALTLGIGFIMIGFTERKQGLHDIIAGTLVLKKL